MKTLLISRLMPRNMKVHSDTSASGKAMSIMSGSVNNMFECLATEISELTQNIQVLGLCLKLFDIYHDIIYCDLIERGGCTFFDVSNFVPVICSYNKNVPTYWLCITSLDISIFFSLALSWCTGEPLVHGVANTVYVPKVFLNLFNAGKNIHLRDILYMLAINTFNRSKSSESNFWEKNMQRTVDSRKTRPTTKD